MDFIVLDFETTGKDTRTALPVEIAMVKVSSGNISDHFHSLVRQNWISEGASAIHGLNATDLIGAPLAKELISKLKLFVQGLPIVAHNAEFDASIARNAEILDAFAGSNIYCSLHLSRRTIDSPAYRLTHLAELLDLPTKPNHRALEDAMATAHLVLKIMELQNRKSFHDLYAEMGLWPGQFNESDFRKPKTYTKGSSHLTAAIRQGFLATLSEDDYIIHPEWIGQEVIFTGELETYSRKEANELAQRMGAIPKDSVNKKTLFVVVGSKPGQNKIEKVEFWRRKGSDITIIDEEEFLSMVAEAEDGKY
jgi:DNA polymerase III subunit epsilon